MNPAPTTQRESKATHQGRLPFRKGQRVFVGPVGLIAFRVHEGGRIDVVVGQIGWQANGGDEGATEIVGPLVACLQARNRPVVDESFTGCCLGHNLGQRILWQFGQRRLYSGTKLRWVEGLAWDETDLRHLRHDRRIFRGGWRHRP
jgi:hypothetical protein